MNQLLRGALFSALAGLILAPSLQAAITDRYWNNTGTTGDFNDGANWNIDNPPVDPFTGPLITGDTAYVNNGGTANITGDVAPVLQWMFVGSGSGLTGAVKQTAGNITVNGTIQAIGGAGGTGSYTMEGGALTLLGKDADGTDFDVYTTPFWGIGTGTGSVGSVVMKNGATITTNGGTRIGDSGGHGTFEMYNNSVLNQSGHLFISVGTGGQATMTLHDSATVNVTVHPWYNGYTLIGQSGGSAGTLNILDSAKFNAGSLFYVGRSNSSGTLNMNSASTTDPATLTVTSSFYVANGDGATTGTTSGTVNMTGTAKIIGNSNGWVGSDINSTGILNMSDDTSLAIATSFYIGRIGGSGEMHMSGHASFSNNGDLQLANAGTAGTTSGILTMTDHASINKTGYIVVGANAAATATLTMDGDSSIVQSGGEVRIGYYGGETGTVTLNGNASFKNTGTQIGNATTATGVLNLNGGIYETSYLRGGAHGTVNFRGSVLKADQDETNWLGTGVVYKVAAAGAKIDTSSFNVRANGNLTEDATSTGGGLTKTGIGALALAGNNTYTGMTNLNEGTLELASANALPGSVTMSDNTTLATSANLTLDGKVIGGSTGTLSVNSGTLIYGANAFTGQITMNGGSMTLNATHPGPLVVNNGTSGVGTSWYHNGSGTVSGLTTVGGSYFTSQDALLGGTGTLGNVLVLNNYGNTPGVKGGLEAGQGGVGSLHMANLTFDGSEFLYLGNPAPGAIEAYTSSAAFIASGTLKLGNSGAGTITVDMGGAALASHTYHLIQHTGAVSYLNGSAITNFAVVNAVLSARQSGLVKDNPGYIDYVVSGFYPVWAGLAGDDTWYQNNTGKLSWTPSTGSGSTYFIDGNVPTPRTGDAVLFNDAGTGHTTVSIPLSVAPVSVTVDSTLNYTFNGAGGIVDSTFATAPKTSLLKENSGMLTINTSNAYTGGTTILNGTIRSGNASALGAGVVAFGLSAPVTAKLQLYGAPLTVAGLVTDAVPGTPVVENGAAGAADLTINNAVANTFAGVFQDGGAGALSVTFAGAAVYTLAAANTYSGTTTVAGTSYVNVGVDNALPYGAGKGNVTFTGGNLDLNGFNANVNALSNSAAAIVTNKVSGTKTLTVGNTDASTDCSISFQNTSPGVLALAKVGAGTLILRDPALSGGVASNYTGGTTLSGGKIQTYYTDALGAGPLTMSPGTTLDLQSFDLNVRGLDGTDTSSLVTTTSSGNYAALTLTATAARSFAGVIQDGSGNLSLKKAGASTQTLTGANTYTGATTINAGTLAVPTLANGGVASPIGASTADSSNLVLSYSTGPTTFGYLSVTAVGASITTNRGLTSNGGGINIPDAGTTVTFTGPVTATAAGSYFLKTGPGTVKFNNTAFGSYDFGSAFNREVYNQGGKIAYDGTGPYDTLSGTGQEYIARVFHTGTNFASSCTISNVTLRTTQTSTGYGFTSGYGSSASNGNVTMTGTATVINTGITVVGFTTGTSSNPTGVLTMSDNAYIDSQSRFFIGTNSGGTTSSATGTVTLNNNAKIQTGTDFLCANSPKGVGTLNLHDNAFIDVGTVAYCGNGGAATIGIYNIDGTAHMNLGRTNTLATQIAEYIGSGATATGTVTLNGDGGADPYITANGIVYVGATGATGTLTLNGNSSYTNTSAISSMRIGANSSTSNGTVNVNGTSAVNANLLTVGYFGGTGVFNANNSAAVTANSILVCNNWNTGLGNAHGTFNVLGAGATITSSADIIVSANGGQDGVWNQNAGLTTAATKFVIGEGDYSDTAATRNLATTIGTGVLNLNGGTLVAPQLSTRSLVTSTNAADVGLALDGKTRGTVNFNGGVLKAAAASADFIATDSANGAMTLNVLAGGAKINSNGFDLTITKALNHGGTVADGGLEKIGTGTLTLSGAIGYTGPTLIDAGRLAIDNGLTTTLTTVSGAGTFAVGATNAATSVTAASIQVSALTIGSGAAAAVPEPGTLALLILAALASIAACRCRK